MCGGGGGTCCLGARTRMATSRREGFSSSSAVARVARSRRLRLILAVVVGASTGAGPRCCEGATLVARLRWERERDPRLRTDMALARPVLPGLTELTPPVDCRWVGALYLPRKSEWEGACVGGWVSTA